MITNKSLFQKNDSVELDTCKDREGNAVDCAPRTMFFDANIAITNGKDYAGAGSEVKVIPNLYEALKNNSHSISGGGDTGTSITCSAEKITINLNGKTFDLAAVIEAIIELNRRTAFINSNKTFTATKTDDVAENYENPIEGTKNQYGDGLPGGTNEGIINA